MNFNLDMPDWKNKAVIIKLVLAPVILLLLGLYYLLQSNVRDWLESIHQRSLHLSWKVDTVLFGLAILLLSAAWVLSRDQVSNVLVGFSVLTLVVLMVALLGQRNLWASTMLCGVLTVLLGLALPFLFVHNMVCFVCVLLAFVYFGVLTYRMLSASA